MPSMQMRGAASSVSSVRWLRQRSIGRPEWPAPRSSVEQVSRLRLELKLEGHAGCVNCLDWNCAGDLLASGSDDRKVNIWRPFSRPSSRVQLDTMHEGNIFSVKFVPQTNDSVVATCASDGSVKLTSIQDNENLLNCCNCLSDRVKRLAVHPSEPYLIWSASEDGFIMEFDRRQRHTCNSSIPPKNLVIDLNISLPHKLAAKCLALNPRRAEMIAVGASDRNIRLYDRRYLTNYRRDTCTAQFSPGHLKDEFVSYWSPGTTYLSFNSDGSELLANMRTDQVYLFNTYEPQKRFLSYETDIRPILSSPSANRSRTPPCGARRDHRHIESRCVWLDLAEARSSAAPEVRDTCWSLYSELRKKCDVIEKKQPSKKILDQINEHLAAHEDCHRMYIVRASALINRGLQGDHYQAIRDACCALALNPKDPYYINILTKALHSNDDKRSASDLMLHLQGEKQAADPTGDRPPLSSKPLGLEGEINLLISNNNYWNEELQVGSRGREVFDYTKRFSGHCHYNTDIKEANFFGPDDEYIVAGSDDGAFYIWNKRSTNIVKAVSGDMSILNCLQAHPSICMLATSGIEPSVKLWSPIGKTCHDVEQLEQRCIQNQAFTTNDPLDAMYSTIFPIDSHEDDW